jgi:predicted ATP-dependent endonuclease of OLD family
MFIASCQVKNYKSFKDWEKIQFRPGFNVVVGQNNAGKTALVEALSVQFSNNPHRSLVTRPEGNSSVKMTFGIEPDEGLDFYSQRKPSLLAGT